MAALLTVCGSLQQGSANRALLDLASAVLRSTHQIDDFAGLRAIPAFDPELADTPPPPVQTWLAALRRADAVLVACPEYAGGMAGALKNAFDWCVGASGVYRVPIAVMSAGTSGGPNAIAQLVRTLTWQGGLVVGTLGVAAPRTKIDPAGTISDPDTVAAVTGLAHLLASAPTMEPAERLALVIRTVSAFGIDDFRVAE